MSFISILRRNTNRILRRNTNRILRHTPPPTAVGTLRPFVTYTGFTGPYNYASAPDVHPDSLPWLVQVNMFGNSSITPAERMMKEVEQPSFHPSASYNGREADAQRNPWSCKQHDDALYFKMDMPGVGKEDAKVYLDGSTLIVKGVRKLEPEFDDDEDEETSPRTHSAGINLKPMHNYKIAGIKAEMKNGVVKITVPKLKDEERQDVLHVQID